MWLEVHLTMLNSRLIKYWPLEHENPKGWVEGAFYGLEISMNEIEREVA